MKLLHLPRQQPSPAVIADLRELLELAESGDLEYVAYVAIQPGGEAMQWEVGSRDPHMVYGLLHELAAQILEANDDESD